LRLRSHLFVLALSTLLPVAAFAVFAAVALVAQERETFRQGELNRTRAIMTAVDAELGGAIAALQALGASPALERGDLRAIHEQAARFLVSQPGWLNITLASPEGQQLVNARQPFGRLLPRAGDAKSLRQAAATGEPVVGNVTPGPVDGEFAVPVRVPVMGSDSVKYILNAVLRPESFAELLRQLRLSEDRVIALVDGQLRFVARIPPVTPGELASESFRAAMREAPEGWFRGRTLEGRDTYTSYTRSAYSEWSVGVAVPASTVLAASHRTAWLMAAGGLVAALVAFAVAYLMARRVSGPISALAASARSIGQGAAPEARVQGRVGEVAEVAAALHETALAVREREAQLRAASRSKDEFLATLSHELRNPLAAIVMIGQALKRSAGNQELVRQSSQILERQSAQMTRLIEDLLDVSRITMGKISLERRPLELSQAVRRLVDAWREAGRLGQHDVRLAARPVWIDADPARIEQIVSNLLGNALKFTPPGGGVELRIAREGSQAVLEIADTGKGLAPELIEQVFDVFVQGDQTIDRARGGLGIGLALVKRLVELHGGSVSAKNAAQGGAVFTVRLPAVAARREPRATPEPAPGSRSARRILVVEDNEDTRRMLRLVLEQEGHAVEEAGEGSQALELARSSRPEVGIIDIGLPGMNGYELAQRLRASLNHEIRLIALTGYGQPEDRERALESGFDEHLTKPVHPEELKHRIG
jgi:signal transduction histidine kinase